MRGERRETIDAHRIAGVLTRIAKTERLRAQNLAPDPEAIDPAVGSVKTVSNRAEW
ncbi:hypothetical protein [Glycomyces harbinensis]|uniref:Uncharacterized protein n=1 Tax=Glycomyces harbinensis TaxID=58114 RepID=A0A1G6SGH3_9ACTN|nr:hypothetical protein [Glycomyces harbinensis]SDD15958.1 hypothetical protein SAMN05216270_10287 [Glycomyces harbinensis]